MTSIFAGIFALAHADSGLNIINSLHINFVAATLWITGFLGLLNIALAILFRNGTKKEVISYYVACIVELAIFVFALLFRLHIIAQVPYHLPPGLPVDRAQIGAALAIGIGLFPAAYWHRINVSDLPGRIAQDAKTMKVQGSGVRVREGGEPGEWMN